MTSFCNHLLSKTSPALHETIWLHHPVKEKNTTLFPMSHEAKSNIHYYQFLQWPHNNILYHTASFMTVQDKENLFLWLATVACLCPFGIANFACTKTRNPAESHSPLSRPHHCCLHRQERVISSNLYCS